ncbi:Scd6-like Sm domain-containing protein [Cunninghamella echinulata]|nr:Scd6-like Sm domain-containing protein [Cunninghamella echinulata]
MSGQNYIGSKISLISLSDIRYVGTLHSINTNDSTVSLENVRSFGTEGRRGNPDDEVAASDTVFDFVVFRGSDIKDLQVFEAPSKPAPPAPQQHAQAIVDPAINHSVKGYPPPMNPYMMPNYPPPQAMYWQTPMYGQQMPLGQPPMPPSNQQQQPQQSSISPSSSLPTLPTAMPQPVPTPNNNEPQSSQQQSATNVNDVQNHLTEQLDQNEIDGAAVENLAKQVSELDVDSTEPEESVSSSSQQQQQQQQSHHRQNNYRGPRHNNTNTNTNANNNNYRQNNSGHTNGTRNQPGKQQRVHVPQSDFDFESSNAKFSKNDLLKELMGGGSNEEAEVVNTNTEQKEEKVIIPPNDEEFYDKSKSFFDNISCESKERQDQELSGDRRGKFHEERRLNMETFGQASVDQSRFRNFRGRGGHRGGNYRGYHRGGNRNHNHNNRNNYGYRPQHQQQQQQHQQQQQQQQQVESQ